MNNRLLNDTIPDESQQGLLDSLAWLSHDIPPDIQDALYALAGECLFEKGTCVLIARSFFPDSVFYNPCEEFIIPSARYAETRNDEQRNNKKEPDIIKVYPNPASKSITVRITGDVEYPVQVKIIDFAGRVVQQRIQTVTEQQYTLDNIAAGVYLYEKYNADRMLHRGKLILSKN